MVSALSRALLHVKSRRQNIGANISKQSNSPKTPALPENTRFTLKYCGTFFQYLPCGVELPTKSRRKLLRSSSIAHTPKGPTDRLTIGLLWYTS